MRQRKTPSVPYLHQAIVERAPVREESLESSSAGSASDYLTRWKKTVMESAMQHNQGTGGRRAQVYIAPTDTKKPAKIGMSIRRSCDPEALAKAAMASQSQLQLEQRPETSHLRSPGLSVLKFDISFDALSSNEEQPTKEAEWSQVPTSSSIFTDVEEAEDESSDEDEASVSLVSGSMASVASPSASCSVDMHKIQGDDNPVRRKAPFCLVQISFRESLPGKGSMSVRLLGAFDTSLSAMQQLHSLYNRILDKAIGSHSQLPQHQPHSVFDDAWASEADQGAPDTDVYSRFHAGWNHFEGFSMLDLRCTDHALLYCGGSILQVRSFSVEVEGAPQTPGHDATYPALYKVRGLNHAIVRVVDLPTKEECSSEEATVLSILEPQFVRQFSRINRIEGCFETETLAMKKIEQLYLEAQMQPAKDVGSLCLLPLYTWMTMDATLLQRAVPMAGDQGGESSALGRRLLRQSMSLLRVNYQPPHAQVNQLEEDERHPASGNRSIFFKRQLSKQESFAQSTEAEEELFAELRTIKSHNSYSNEMRAAREAVIRRSRRLLRLEANIRLLEDDGDGGQLTRVAQQCNRRAIIHTIERERCELWQALRCLKGRGRRKYKANARQSSQQQLLKGASLGSTSSSITGSVNSGHTSLELEGELQLLQKALRT
ncbi:unnamed protein product [Chrysoparadoxa australica]